MNNFVSGKQPIEFESKFDINKLSFDNVSKDFENKYREKYKDSLGLMVDTDDCMQDTSGATALGLLEQMGRQISEYDKNTDFDKTYNQLSKEYEPYRKT